MGRFRYTGCSFGGVKLAIGCAVLILPGCTGGPWKTKPGTASGPAAWLRSLFPPEGETFYNDQSHDIERSLDRHRQGSASLSID
ncbi:MAG: hypothetical protein FJ297_16750 [Planctomycetes bacterium]|nr:hypothetical protein [Planctomycetota bacterium]